LAYATESVGRSVAERQTDKRARLHLALARVDTPRDRPRDDRSLANGFGLQTCRPAARNLSISIR